MNPRALIKELDRSLALTSGCWLEATPSRKGRYERQIDRMLDERLRLMKLRDKA